MRYVTRHLGRRFLRTALLVALAGTLLAPPVASAEDTTPTVEPPAARLPGPAVAPADAYEDDDTAAAARVLLSPDVWSAMSRFGATPLTQARTFDIVNDAAPDASDQDWVRFTVDDAAISVGMSLLIEAVSNDARVDPVIEVYGPLPAGELPTPTRVSALLPAEDGDTATDSAARAGFDDDPWFASRGSSAALTFDPYGNAAGTYFVRIRPYWAGRTGGFGGGAGGYTLRVKAGLATRLQGRDRYETAVRVSRERVANGELAGGACVVASGAGFADALAGSTLAGALRGPLLLTAPGSLPTAVAAEIRRLGVATVYVLGGTRAVDRAVATAIGRQGVGVQRVAGRDRYETAVRVAEVSRVVLRARGDDLAPFAFVASGASFPDALSAAPMAAYNGAPVLLTTPTKPHSAMLGALARLGIRDAVVVGGTPAVSVGVQRAVERRLGGAGHVRRIAGGDRYATSRAFAAWAVAGGPDARVGTASAPAALEALQPSSVGLASGATFADALTGGVLCGMRGAPVLLTAPAKLSAGVLRYFDSLVGTFDKSYAFGGSPAISQAAMDHFDLLTTAWWGPQ